MPTSSPGPQTPLMGQMPKTGAQYEGGLGTPETSKNVPGQVAQNNAFAGSQTPSPTGNQTLPGGMQTPNSYTAPIQPGQVPPGMSPADWWAMSPQQQQQYAYLYNYGQTQNQQNVAQAGVALGGLQQTGQNTMLQNQMSQANAQQNAGLSLQQLGLTGQQLGISLSEQQSALPFMQQQQGETLQQEGISNQLMGIQDRQQQQSQRDSMAVSGNTNTAGGNQGWKDLLGQQFLGAKDQAITQQMQGQQYGRSYQLQQDAVKNAQLAIQQNGLSETQVKNQLNQTIAQLGLSGQISAEQIQTAMNQIAAGLPAQNAGVIAQILPMIQFQSPQGTQSP